jgi:hypothetical protein
MQDTEAAARGHGLYLNFGAVAEGERPAVGIGNEILDALQRHGLTTDWDGTWAKRIHVTLDWKRRLSD